MNCTDRIATDALNAYFESTRDHNTDEFMHLIKEIAMQKRLDRLIPAAFPAESSHEGGATPFDIVLGQGR